MMAMDIKELLDKMDETFNPVASDRYAGAIVDRLRAALGDSLLSDIAAAGPDRVPCVPGTIVWVDADTLPHNYLHPVEFSRDEKFAKCEVIGVSVTKRGTFIKMVALYPSRQHKRGYLRYGFKAIGKTVFFSREAAMKRAEE